MARYLKPMRDTWTRHLVVALGMLVLSAAAIAQPATSDDTYTWSAELVAFDDSAPTVTVKALVVGREMDDWSAFSEGDQVMLTWSGVFSASGVRHVSHEADPESTRFTMPVEFVAAEMDGRYIVFKVPVPEGDATMLDGVMPGDWITGTSPAAPAGPEDVVAEIRPYAATGE